MLAACTVFAQKDSLKAVIEVENDYNPVVIKATKLNSTPLVETATENTPLDLMFSHKATLYNRFASERNVKEILPKQEACLPGYARLGYGNGNNIDAKAAYRISPSKNEQIGLLFSLNGFKTSADGYNEHKWDSRFFTTWVGGEYTRRFKNFTMNIGAEANNKVFNYQTIQPAITTDKQNNGSYGIRADMESHGMGAFSYKTNAAYTLRTKKYSNGDNNRINENHLELGGSIAYELPNEDLRRIGTDVSIDGFIYNDALKPQYGNKYDNYTLIGLNPFIDLRLDNWDIRLGAHADMLTANGAFIAFAPDCHIEGYMSRNLTLYVTATGGRKPVTFAMLDAMSPYNYYMQGNEQYTPIYTVADITAGTRISFESATVNIYAGYSYTKDDMLPTVSENGILFTGFEQHASRSIYIGGRFGYDHAGWLNLCADARYNNWNCTSSDNLLLYKPMITVALNAEARLSKGIYANIGYTFERYTKGEESRCDSMNELAARIRYQMSKQIGIFISGRNLLGSDYFAYPGYIAQGANVIGGISIGF